MAWEPSAYKKDVTGEMPNAYDPKAVEQCWGEFWEKEGLMGADAEVSRRRTAPLLLPLPPLLRPLTPQRLATLRRC